jgi:hypothetical protein
VRGVMKKGEGVGITVEGDKERGGVFLNECFLE